MHNIDRMTRNSFFFSFSFTGFFFGKAYLSLTGEG